MGMLDTTLGTVTTALRDCVIAALDARPETELPGRACRVPGALAWDECECGLLGLTIGRIYQSATFPNQAADTQLADPCTVPWLAADIAVTLLRCAPQPEGAALAPTCTALSAAAEAMLIDLDTVRRALGCCLVDLRDRDIIAEYVLKDTFPAGPEGACVGTVTNLTVGVPNCLCPA